MERKCPSTKADGTPLETLAEKGARWTSGKKEKLAESAAYTPEFGQAVAALLTKGRPRSVATLLGASSSSESDDPSWGQICELLDGMLQARPSWPAGCEEGGLHEVIRRMQLPQTIDPLPTTKMDG